MIASKHLSIATLVAAAPVAAAIVGVGAERADAVLSVRGSCDRSKGTTVVQNQQVRVFRLAGSVWACASGRNRWYAIHAGACFPESACGVRRVAIGGRFVAYSTFYYGEDVTSRSVEVLNPRAGRLYSGVALDGTQPTSDDGAVSELVVSTTGQVAWVYRTSGSAPVSEVHVGASIVDRSAGVLPGSLAIAGDTAYWMRDGTVQSATGAPLSPVPD